MVRRRWPTKPQHTWKGMASAAGNAHHFIIFENSQWSHITFQSHNDKPWNSGLWSQPLKLRLGGDSEFDDEQFTFTVRKALLSFRPLNGTVVQAIWRNGKVGQIVRHSILWSRVKKNVRRTGTDRKKRWLSTDRLLEEHPVDKLNDFLKWCILCFLINILLAAFGTFVSCSQFACFFARFDRIRVLVFESLFGCSFFCHFRVLCIFRPPLTFRYTADNTTHIGLQNNQFCSTIIAKSRTIMSEFWTYLTPCVSPAAAPLIFLHYLRTVAGLYDL